MSEIIIICVLFLLVGVLIFLLFLENMKNRAKTSRKADKKTKDATEKAPVEFSKRILIASYVIAVAVIIYTMYIIHLMVIGGYTGDPSSLNTLIMLTLGELGAANSFYFWKSRLENKIKLENQYGSKILEEVNEEDIV